MMRSLEKGRWYPVIDGSEVRADREDAALLLIPVQPGEDLDASKPLNQYPDYYAGDTQIVEFTMNTGSWRPINDFDVSCSGIVKCRDYQETPYKANLAILDGPGRFLQIAGDPTE